MSFTLIDLIFHLLALLSLILDPSFFNLLYQVPKISFFLLWHENNSLGESLACLSLHQGFKKWERHTFGQLRRWSVLIISVTYCVVRTFQHSLCGQHWSWSVRTLTFNSKLTVCESSFRGILAQGSLLIFLIITNPSFFLFAAFVNWGKFDLRIWGLSR